MLLLPYVHRGRADFCVRDCPWQPRTDSVIYRILASVFVRGGHQNSTALHRTVLVLYFGLDVVEFSIQAATAAYHASSPLVQEPEVRRDASPSEALLRYPTADAAPLFTLHAT